MSHRIAGYASGIFELAKAEGELERVEVELLAVSQALAGSTDLRSTLTDPQLPLDRKQAIGEDLVGGRASALTVGLVQLVVGQGRASELPQIARTLVETAAASRHRAVAEVRTAVALDDETVARLAEALSRATGKSVEVKVFVDPSVIGGVVARVGDTNITMGQFVKAAKFTRYQLISQYLSVVETMQFFGGDPSSEQFFQQQLSQILTQLNDPNTLGQSAIDTLVNAQLVRLEAQRRVSCPAAAYVRRIQPLRQLSLYRPLSRDWQRHSSLPQT